MNFIKALIWLLVGVGLTVSLTTEELMVQRVGRTLAVVMLLWRLLIYLRDTRPSDERLNALPSPSLSVTEMPPFSQPALPAIAQPIIEPTASPVQRLIGETPER